MCAPLAALPALALISGGIGAAGGLVSTYAKIQQDNMQAQVADANAAAERQSAVQDQTNMNQAALQRYQQISQVEGQQRAASAANGVAVDFGSSGAQQAGTALLGDMDVNKVYQQGYQAQRGHDVNVANDQATASAARANATGAAIGGALSFGSTVLGSVTQYSKLKQMMGVGNWTNAASTDRVGLGL